MKSFLVSSAFVLAFATPALASAYTPTVNRSDVDDTRLVSAFLSENIRVHLGESPLEVGGAQEITSDKCTYVATDGWNAEFDCSAAVSQALAAADPSLAGVPLIYPAVMKGYALRDRSGGVHPGFDQWELVVRPVRIITATKTPAAQAPSFAGVGFYRMGYEFSSDMFFENYTTPQARAFQDTTRDTQQLVPTAKLKSLGDHLRRADGAPVVFHEFVFLLVEEVHRPWISAGGWGWLPGANSVIKPFAQFEANGVTYRNYDDRGRDYQVKEGVNQDFLIEYQ